MYKFEGGTNYSPQNSYTVLFHLHNIT
jgi:hypothetical protein